MELKSKILDSLDDCTAFTHSSIDLAKERLQERSLNPLVLAVFCDSFRADVDKAVTNYVDSYMDYFDGNDNFVTYIPMFNGTSRKLVRALRSRSRRVSGVTAAEGDWKISEEEQEERVIDKILERADAILFVSDGKSRDFRHVYHRVCEAGYLVSRRVFNETRSKKGRRSQSD